VTSEQVKLGGIVMVVAEEGKNGRGDRQAEKDGGGGENDILVVGRTMWW
jgi:hypothetical protein